MPPSRFKKSKRAKRSLSLLAILALTALLGNTAYISLIHDNGNEGESNEIIQTAAWTLNPIRIDNNWSAMEAMYDWVTGKGTYWDPYIIEDVVINANNKRAIHISYTNDFFIIRNCTLYNAGAGNSGIRLESVRNGRIEGNTLRDNSYGMFVLQSHENTIYDNEIFNNVYGIYFQSSNNNLLTGNRIYNQTGTGVTATITSNSNEFKNNNISENNDNGILIDNNCFSNIIDNNTISRNARSGYGGININGGDNNEITNNAIEENYEGIYLINKANKNLIVENNITDSENHGIHGIKMSNNSIGYNRIENNNNTGIFIEDWESSGNDISYNSFVDNPTAIKLDDADSNNIYQNDFIDNNISIRLESSADSNTIQKNNMTSKHSSGIILDNVNNNEIKENDIRDLSEEGIKVEWGWYNNISNNIIHNTSKAIYLHEAQYVNIINNTLTNSTQEQIMIENSQNNVLEHNVIANGSSDGLVIIRLFGVQSDYNKVSFNNFTNNQGFGVVAAPNWNSDYNGIYYNNFIDNNQGTTQASNNLNLNFFYNSSGPNLGNYWNEHASTDNNMDGVWDTAYNLTGAGSDDIRPLRWPWQYYKMDNVYVNPSYNNNTMGWNNTRFSNITAALNRLAVFWNEPSTIHVSNGTYNENLIVNQTDISIIGEDRDNVTIQGNGSSSVIQLTNMNTMLKDLTIINSSLSGAGILITGSDNLVENCIVRNNTLGVLIQDLMGGDMNMITECIIANNSISGIQISPVMIFMSAIGNEITNNHIANNSQYGIELQGRSASSSFIDDTLIEGNLIENNWEGIYTNDDVRNTNIENNNITSNKFNGLRIDSNTQNTLITENIIEYNANYGLIIGIGASGIQVYLNEFINNNNMTNGSAQARDDNAPGTNVWDNGWIMGVKNMGNYWYNWTVSADNDHDGILDNPYMIDSSVVPSSDMYPLAYEIEYYDLDNLYVDDDFNNTVLGWNCTRFNTTQDAIDAARKGAQEGNESIITVYNGTYTENIVIDKTVRLIGESVSQTIINAKGNGTTISILSADDVFISNFTVMNDSMNEYGIFVNDSQDTGLYNLNVTENEIGIHILDSIHTRIENCTISNNNEIGISSKNGSILVIIDCVFKNWFDYLQTENTNLIYLINNKFYFSSWVLIGSDGEAQNHVVINNMVNDKPLMYSVNTNFQTISEPLGELILVNCNWTRIHDMTFSNATIGMMIYNSQHVNISHNDFENLGNAVVLIGPDNSTFHENTIENCFDTGLFIVSNSNYNEFYNNTIINCVAAGLKFDGQGQNNSVHDNIIRNNTNGIEISKWSSYIFIYQNNITNNSQYGIVCNGSNNVIYINNIINNSKYGVFCNGSNNIISYNNFIGNGFNQSYDSYWMNYNDWWSTDEQEGNYWEMYETRYPSANITNGIWSIPYQIDGDSNIWDAHPLAYPAEYYDRDVIYVDDDFNNDTIGWNVTRFNTTQEGIDAVNEGGIVHVANGIYIENIMINKSVSLIGESTAGTKIFAKKQNVSAIFMNDVKDVTLDKLTIGNSSVPNLYYGHIMGPFTLVCNDTTNLVLRNLNVTSSIKGLYLMDSIDALIEESTFANFTAEDGISIKYSERINIFNNTIHDSYLMIENSLNLWIDDNEFYNTGFVVPWNVNQAKTFNVPDTNTVNGDPVIYRVNSTGLNFEGVYGQIFLVNVTYSTVHHSQFSDTAIAIQLIGSDYNNISFNQMTDVPYSIFNWDSHNSTIAGNTLNSLNYDGNMNHMGGISLLYSENCTIVGNRIQYFEHDSKGIDISDSNKTMVYGNLIENCSYGVYSNNDAYDNSVFRNIIANNSNYGIYTKAKHYNSFFQNNFYDNGGNQSQAFDDNSDSFTNNSWYADFLSRGNYWNDYTTRYALATPVGVYWNIPYEIDNSSDTFNLTDQYPLIDPYPVIPKITVISPDDNVANNTHPTFVIEVQSFLGIDKMWFTINGSAQKHFFTDNSSIDLEWGTYGTDVYLIVKFYINNTYNFVGESENFTVHKETELPQLSDLIYTSKIEWNEGSFNVTCNITDNFKLRDVDPVVFRAFYPNGTGLMPSWEAMFNMGGNNYTTWGDPSHLDTDEDYYFIINATDNATNVYSTGKIFFNITDTYYPEVTVNYYDTEAEFGLGHIYVNVTVTDNYGIQPPVEIEFFNPSNSSLGKFTMSFIDDGIYVYNQSVGTNTPLNFYYFQILAEDQNGNLNDTIIRYFRIYDDDNPSVSIDSYSASVEYGSEYQLTSTTITDNHQLQSVLIRYYSPNYTIMGTYSMSTAGGDTWTHQTGNLYFQPLANYSFRIIVQDFSGNYNTTEVGNFSIVDTVDPVISDITYDNEMEWNNDQLIISCNVTDNYQLYYNDPVSIDIYYPNGDSIISAFMTHISGNNFTYTWNVAGEPLGTLYYFVIGATDNVSNSLNSGNQYFDIEDTTLPQLADITYDVNVEWDTGTLVVSCNATDNYGLKDNNPVEIRIWSPLNAPLIDWTAMSFVSDNNYTFNWGVGANDIDVNYYFQIRVTDNNTNVYPTGNNIFNIVDTVDPVITDITYDSTVEWSTGTLYIVCNVTDNYGLEDIDPVEIQIRHPNGTLILDWTAMTKGSVNEYSYSWGVAGYDINTSYYFNLRATDNSSNILGISNNNFNIVDTVDPQITDITYDSTVEWSTGQLDVDCNVTDNYDLNSTDPVLISIYYPNGTLINTFIMTSGIGNQYTYQWIVAGYDLNVSYYFIINATDVSNNELSTSNQNFDIVDTVIPNIINLTSDAWVEWSTGTLHVSCNITDNYGLSLTPVPQIKIFNPLGSNITGWIVMNNPYGDIFTHDWAVVGNDPDGNYYFKIRSYDKSDNLNSTDDIYFDINDTVIPTVIIYSYDASTEYAGSIEVIVNVTDNHLLKASNPVQIKIYYPNGTFIGTFTMTGPIDNQFSYTWSTGSHEPLNNYNFTIIAYDISLNINNTMGATFNITDLTAPIISGPGNDPNPVPDTTTSLEIFATVTDNYELNATNPVIANLYYPNNTFIVTLILTLVLTTNKFNVSWDPSGYDVLNGYVIQFNATDALGNYKLLNKTFNIVSGSPPSISNAQVDPTDLEYGYNLTISCNASDSGTVHHVYAYVYYPNGTLITFINMTNVPTTGYIAQWNSSGIPIQYVNTSFYVIINATDNDVNSSWTADLLFNIIKTPPTINNPGLNTTSLEYAHILNISATVTDDETVASVKAFIYYENNTLITEINLIKQLTSNVWNNTWNGSYKVLNGYYIIINATDNRGYNTSTGKIAPLTFDIVDTIDPNIFGIVYNTPVEWGTGTLSITCEVTDNYKLKAVNPVEIRFFDPSGSPITDWEIMTFSGGNTYTYNYILDPLDPDNDIGLNYNFTIRATDSENNINATVNENFDITDTVQPVIFDISYVTPVEWSMGTLQVQCNITDNYDLNSTNPVQISIYYPNGTLILDWTNMNPQTGNASSYNWAVVGYDLDVNYYFRIRANDVSNNLNITYENKTFDITDTVDPVITSINYASNVEWSTGSLDVTCNVTDNYGLNATNPIQIKILGPLGQLLLDWTDMTHDTGAKYTFSNSSLGNDIGINYYFYIRARDVTNNTKITANKFYNIIDTVNPQIDDIIHDVQVEWSTGILNISCNATDNYRLRDNSPVEIKIYNTLGTNLTSWITMTPQGGANYSYSWAVAGNDVGINYYFKIRTYDNSSNPLETSEVFFNITDTVNPQVSTILFNNKVEWSTGDLDISVIATDNDDLLGTNPVRLAIYHPNGTLIGIYNMDLQSGNKYYYNWSVGAHLIDINYIFNITVYDFSNNTITSTDFTFDIEDTVDPVITLTEYDDKANYATGDIFVNITVTDNYKLKDLTPVNISFYYPNGTLIGTHVMDNPSGNAFNYTWDVNTYPQASGYYFRIIAIDNQSNVKYSSNITFNIVDEEKPNIFVTGYTNVVEYITGTIIVNVSVTDNFQIDPSKVYIDIHAPSTALLGAYSMNQIGTTNTFNYSLDVTNTGLYSVQNGYYFVITAWDISSNSNNTVNKLFNIVDTTPASIISIDLVNQTYHGAPPSFNFQFTEIVSLKYYVLGMGANETVGSGANQYNSLMVAFHFNGLSEGWFNLTFYFEDVYNNKNTTRFLLYKDVTDPDFDFPSGSNPAGKSFTDDTAPIFYIDIEEDNVKKITYEIPSLLITFEVFTAKLATSGPKTSDMSNVAVPIQAGHWALVPLGSVLIIIRVFDNANNNYSISFTVTKAEPITTTTTTVPAGPDMMFIFLIIIIIGAAVGIGGGVVVSKKKKSGKEVDLPQKKLSIRAAAPRAKSGKMVDGKVAGAKAVKAKKAGAVAEDKSKKGLTEAEKAEMEATEAEMGVEKEKHVCVVHKGPIKGAIYLCPSCETFYCLNCARTLKKNGEKCWACEADIEVQVEDTEALEKADSTSTQGILESLTIYDANFKKAMKEEKAFKSVPQLNVIDFNLIDPEINELMDKLDVAVEVKSDILKDLMGLPLDEQKILFDLVYQMEQQPEEDEQ